MITLQTIADRAGVSRAAVSLILNNRHTAVRISEATRCRVLAEARRQGYQRNEIARSMITGATQMIGFVPLYATEEYIFRIIVGAMEAADAAGYLIKLLPSADSPQAPGQIAEACIRNRLAGVICRNPRGQTIRGLRRALAPHGIPLVTVDCAAAIACDGSVRSDDRGGMKLAVRHLAGLGHRHLAHLTIRPQGRSFATVRREGFEKAVAACGLPRPAIWMLSDGTVRVPGVSDRELDALVCRKPPPSAVICASDFLAMALLQACQRHGVRVPEDLSVIGFADLRLVALASPPLTTVRQKFEDMGRVAAQLVLEQIEARREGREAPVKEVLLETELVERASTAAPSDGIGGGKGRREQ